MNAVMHKYAMTKGADMPAGENDSLAVQVAELRADVRHVQADVTDLKADLRVTNQRIESLRKDTAEGFDKVDQRFESQRKETGERFEKVEKEIGEVKNSLASAKIWALGLYFALAGSLLYVLARGFKWL
jgi:chromosome segregation ATPase